MNDVLTRNHYEIFGACLKQPNSSDLLFVGLASAQASLALSLATEANCSASDALEKTQSLALHRYTAEGERVSNITEWGLRQFCERYGDDISAEDVFA